MYKILFIYATVAGMFTCHAQTPVSDKFMKVTLYDHGQTQKWQLESGASDSLYSLASLFPEQASERLRIRVSPDRIESAKQQEKCIEFEFPDTLSITNPTLGNLSFSKMMIYLEGDFASGSSSGSVFFGLGLADIWKPTLYVCPKGDVVLEQIYRFNTKK